MTDIDALCDALVSSNVDAIAALIRQIEARGVSPDACYLDYIGAAARRMGERWVDDCATFMEVTLAGGRLVSMLRELAFSFGGPEITPLPGHTILISNVPGEAHHLGAAIAAEYFRRARWRVVLLDGADRQEIRACLAAEKFAVVGVSAGSRRMVPTLAETVRDVRRICPDAVVCVGGHILALEPEIVRTTGADHAGADPAMLAVLLRRHIPLPTLGPEFHHVEV
ncbi:MAG: B12-binding domain-containing protein [Paracoccaceae bacterium]